MIYKPLLNSPFPVFSYFYRYSSPDHDMLQSYCVWSFFFPWQIEGFSASPERRTQTNLERKIAQVSKRAAGGPNPGPREWQSEALTAEPQRNQLINYRFVVTFHKAGCPLSLMFSNRMRCVFVHAWHTRRISRIPVCTHPWQACLCYPHFSCNKCSPPCIHPCHRTSYVMVAHFWKWVAVLKWQNVS